MNNCWNFVFIHVCIYRRVITLFKFKPTKPNPQDNLQACTLHIHGNALKGSACF